ncbi:hypothetical protein BRYFOR_09150 [Marvinbryantia formatexigens DSM 14469]|uniref:Uncharacterized protein n=1 Tax=Marvinbryantia formatexigens DSM 14469 TaxID=478749 RepID=C6LKG3_9FIRM|nr:hypothetical protein BRYFOR_09150 [Marvinbryantia formatexigens DSM 14469]
MHCTFPLHLYFLDNGKLQNSFFIGIRRLEMELEKITKQLENNGNTRRI